MMKMCTNIEMYCMNWYILPVCHDHLQIDLSPALLSRLILESYITEHSIAGIVYHYRFILYSCSLHHTVCCFGLVIVITKDVYCVVF